MILTDEDGKKYEAVMLGNDSQGMKYYLEPIKERWRAKEGQLYYRFYNYRDYEFIDEIEEGNELNDIHYKLGNYFRTKDQAREACGKVRALLLSLHEGDSKKPEPPSIISILTDLQEGAWSMGLQGARHDQLNNQYQKLTVAETEKAIRSLYEGDV